jgi:hypothetical protein
MESEEPDDWIGSGIAVAIALRNTLLNWRMKNAVVFTNSRPLA